MATERGDLARIYQDIERGILPPADGTIRVVPQPSERDAAVVAFTAHFIVAADVDPAWAYAMLPPGDFNAPLSPTFLSALGEKLNRRCGSLDFALLAPGLEGEPKLPLEQIGDGSHPRVARALTHRDDVRIYATEGAVLTIAKGLGGRYEASFEVDEAYRGQGLGRQLVRASRHLVPQGASVWCQVSPGNAASVRAVLAAGFTPIGSEVILSNAH